LKAKHSLLQILFLCLSIYSFAQTARIQGIVLDENGKPVDNVNVKSTDVSTTTDKNGYYILNVNREVYERVCIDLLGVASEKYPYKKSKRQNNYQEIVYVWYK
jgi:uncharacterized membrane protein